MARMTTGRGGVRMASGVLLSSAAPRARMVAGGGGARSALGALISSAAPGDLEEDDESEEGEESGEEPAPIFRVPPLPVYVLPAPAASDDHLEAPPVERRTIAENRVPWIVPPAIPCNWKGKWDKWELGEINNKRTWIYRGKKVSMESKCWYDRSLGRHLYFGQFNPPPGLLDWEHFGSPVPQYLFFVESGNHWIPKKPSH
jgi:hypothetical protein